MPISASVAGTRFEPHTVLVSARQALAYAASIGCDPEPWLDDARPGGLIAPPPFCVALEWRLSGDPRIRAAIGISADEAARAIHTGQDTRFHRPLMAGENVTISGQIKAVRASRAGAIVTTRITVSARDPADAISTSLIEAIYRGVETDASPATRPTTEIMDEGAAAQHRIEVPRTLPHLYTEASGIWNPIHTERLAAKAIGLDDIVVHGTSLWALVWAELERKHGSVSRLSGRFASMATPGLPVTLVCGPVENASLQFRLATADGATAITAGIAEFSGV